MPDPLKPEIFQSFWYGGELSPLAWLSLSTFVRRGYEFKLYCFDPVIAPRGVTLCSAEAILEKNELFFVHNSYAPFADLFRYHLLCDQGSWWTDTDVILVGEDFPKKAIVFAEEARDNVNVAVLKFPHGHPLLVSLVSEMRRLDLRALGWGKSGPAIFTRYIKEFELYGECVPTKIIYPLNWIEAYKFILPEYLSEVEEKIDGALFVHIWNSIFVHWGFSTREHMPLAGSYLDNLYHDFGVYERFSLKRIDAEYLRKNINCLRTESHWVERAKNSGKYIPD